MVAHYGAKVTRDPECANLQDEVVVILTSMIEAMVTWHLEIHFARGHLHRVPELNLSGCFLVNSGFICQTFGNFSKLNKM